VHIFNLEQTRFQVPHWLTEGLAVVNEGFPRPQQWNQLLLQRVPAGDLMNLDDIDLGFIRPRNPDTWQMAYCQSRLYVEYLRDKHGPDSIGALLNAYRDGLDTDAAIARVCRVKKEAFEKGYQAYLKEVVHTLKGRPVQKPMTLEQLRKAHQADPEDLEVAAGLAEQYQLRRRNAEARKLADGVLSKNKAHPLASYVKARLLEAAGEQEEALRLLQAAVDPRSPEPKVLKALGKLYFEMNDFVRAAQTYELGRKAEPHDSQWLVELAKVYAQAGEKEKRIQALQELAPANADDLDTRKQLAQLLLQERRFAEAEQSARQALEIDVLDAAAQEALQTALRGQKKDAEAERIRQVLTKHP
jgi:tetratricopeptide (TPR) repeat protein